MSNKALEQLQFVNDLVESGERSTEQVQSTQAEIRASQVSTAGNDKQQAGFSAPEALVTALGVGWLLGPAGGVLAGIAQGILGKQAKQNALDQYARDSEILSQGSDIWSDSMAVSLDNADNVFDVEQLTGIDNLFQRGLLNSRAASPELQRLGAEQMAQAEVQKNEFNVRQEEQFNQYVVADQVAKKALDDQAYKRMQELRGQFRVDTDGFENRISIANNVIQSLRRGDGAAVTAALAQMPLLLNPQAGATSEGEVNIWTGVDGVINRLLGDIQQEFGEGSQLTDATRRKIEAVAVQYKKNSIGEVEAIQAKYGKLMGLAGIPAEFSPFFNKTNSVPGYQGGAFISRDDPVGRSNLRPVAPGVSRSFGENVEWLLGAPGRLLKNASDISKRIQEEERERQRHAKDNQ